MKQKDVALIVVITIISGVVSFVASNKLFVTADNRAQQVEVVDPISATFQRPDEKYFNATSVNSTQESSIGGDNQNPFNGSGK